jgi:hypothetical protein
MASEPEPPGSLRDEWMVMLFLAITLVAAIGVGAKFLLGL